MQKVFSPLLDHNQFGKNLNFIWPQQQHFQPQGNHHQLEHADFIELNDLVDPINMNLESNNWQVPLQEEVQEPILPDGDSKSSITLSLGSDLGSHSSHNSGQGHIGDQVQGFGL